jgi:hypothetical protein
MDKYGFSLVTREEARQMKLPEGSGMFSELFNAMENEVKRHPEKENDYKDAMTEIKQTEQYQQQTQLQREKETNRNVQQDKKNQIEREKLQVQREIADKQLEVARENKNKYDMKNNKEQ